MGHPEESGHGCLLYDQTQKAVLIIKDKKLPKEMNIEQQVRLVDVYSTVLELLNIKHDKKILDGISLVPIVTDNIDLELLGYSETFYPEEQTQSTGKFSHVKNKIAFRIDNKHKIIFHLDSSDFEVYNLEKDPNELNNIYKNKLRVKSQDEK